MERGILTDLPSCFISTSNVSADRAVTRPSSQYRRTPLETFTLKMLDSSPRSLTGQLTGTHDDKKVVYAESPYVLTQQISEADEWTAESIAERQTTLTQYALQAWPDKWT